MPRSSPNGAVCKLRFRVGGKQHSRYVGKKPTFIALIERELAQLQSESRATKRLRRLEREAMDRLRRTKKQLEPLLSRAGRVFHGRAIRRQRHEPNRV